MKRIDATKYPHFFRFNRISELCGNPELSIAEICSWTGLTPQTVSAYMERSPRFIRSTAEKMRKSIALNSCKKGLRMEKNLKHLEKIGRHLEIFSSQS